MKEQIENLKNQALEEIAKSESSKELNDLRVKYLGKKGELTSILRGMGELSPEERPKMGALVNSAKQEVENEIQEKEKELAKKELQERLEKEEIPYFMLTGKTKVETRIRMVDEFNTRDDVKVFLISLKAGGTGLNLTGADMVIHYDPWWNASAENQATDRAYRIGQKNNVQVYKLITKNSIEEKIYELQQKKSQLIDNMLDTKTSFISKLSKEDIMKLFE